ncbi:hypothetical protein ASF43_24235 [Pseudorhodoferax sp. Leaf267]|nr:hypothetical protein ASF43_24235 [Pseudorhodoferax sp. Leaf267]
MGDVIGGLVRLVLQVVLLLAGLVVAAGIFVAVAVLAVVFGLRVLWARITGKPVIAFGMGIDPSQSWRRYRDWQQQATRRGPRGAPGADTGARAEPSQDVEDVQIKEVRPPR